jgi:hypothetical protein
LTQCLWINLFFPICDSSNALWHTAYGAFPINANEGCRDPDVPGMTSICFDWGNGRGHFYFQGQGKRCFRKWSDLEVGLCWDELGRCSILRWNEVACTW